jgi:hypothetical protein
LERKWEISVGRGIADGGWWVVGSEKAENWWISVEKYQLFGPNYELSGQNYKLSGGN